MSIRTVRQEIQKALENSPPAGCVAGHSMNGARAEDIVKDAERGIVTPGEAKLIGDLFDRQPTPPRPGHMMTMACPESPGLVAFDSEAAKTFNEFFVKHDLPYGANRAAVKARIEATLENGYGPERSSAPNLKSLHHVFIRDQRPVDGPMVEAYVDTKKDQVYVKLTGAGMGGPHTVGPFWYGPQKLAEVKGAVTPETRAKLLAAFEAAASSLSYTNSLPVGSKYTRVPLKADGFPDGYTYTALIPSGAVSPTAQAKDPNKATQFFVERSGGFAGWTQYAGPIKIGAVEAPTAQLPQGIAALKLTTIPTFGGMAPMIEVSGARNTPAWKVEIGAPQIDESKKTVTLRVSAKNSGQITTQVITPFAQHITLDGLAGKTGNWTIRLVDKDGGLLRSATLEQFNIF